MESQFIFTIVLAVFNFLLSIVVLLVGFIFKNSMANLNNTIIRVEKSLEKSMDELKSDTRDEIKEIKEDNDNLGALYRALEASKADKKAVQKNTDDIATIREAHADRAEVARMIDDKIKGCPKCQ